MKECKIAGNPDLVTAGSCSGQPQDSFAFVAVVFKDSEAMKKDLSKIKQAKIPRRLGIEYIVGCRVTSPVR